MMVEDQRFPSILPRKINIAKCATTIHLHIVALYSLYRYYLLYLHKPKTQLWYYMVEIIYKMSKPYKKDDQLGKVRKRANIRNPYNQVPHLTQDTT